jgi:DNA-binding CsgD family transcriptional regulator
LIDVETTGTCDELCLSLRAGRLALKPGVVVRHVSPPQAYFETRGISRSGNYLADDDLLTKLIGRIYDAAMAPALWPDTLAQIAGFVGGQAAGIFTKDSISKDGTPQHHFGVHPKQVQIYSETHSRLDPFSNLRFVDVGQVVSIADLVPQDEFYQGRFFREWMEPQGWIDAANCVLEKAVSHCSFLTIMRGEEQGAVDEDMRERMALVVPHVCRAMLIGRVVDLEQIRTAALANVLDGLRAGLFLIASDGVLLHTNSAGGAMLAGEDCLRSVGGRLSISDDLANAMFQEALTVALPAGIRIKNLALPVIAPNGDRYVVHVLPLNCGARREARAAHGTTAAVFVRKAVMDDLNPKVIARAFDLTPAELRVLLAVVEVGGIPQAASLLGVADSTVKTHVGRLFEKTGTSRQADLVKLAAGYCNPLLN